MRLLIFTLVSHFIMYLKYPFVGGEGDENEVFKTIFGIILK